jgi:hypothetical protein
MRNKPESILWSLEMIKRSSSRPDGCVIKDTGGFIKDGQIDDLIDMIKEHKKHKIQFMAEQDKISNKTEKPKEFDEYWNEKSMRKNE